jgi:hypothetical protein
MTALYGFAYTESALKYLETMVPTKIRSQIKRRIEALAANPIPPGSKKLIGIMDGKTPSIECDKATTESYIRFVPSSS